MTFAEFLDANLEELPARRGQRVRHVLEMKPGRRRTRVLARLESDAVLYCAKAKLGATVGGDWSRVATKFEAVDWQAFFTTLLAFLEKILPLILPLLM